jgi:hypothetical protein
MSASPNSGEKATPALIHVKGQAVARTNIFHPAEHIEDRKGQGQLHGIRILHAIGDAQVVTGRRNLCHV